jgi:hypothetical protein
MTNIETTVPAYLANHHAAMRLPRAGFEAAIVGMLNAWLEYEITQTTRYQSEIGADYVLGPAWEAMGHAIRGLLNGETGRLDCGTIDGIICNRLRAQGFTV